MKYIILAVTFILALSINGNAERISLYENDGVTPTASMDTCDIPALIARDTTVCAGTVLKLAEDIFFTSTTYSWSPGMGLNDSTRSGPTVVVEEDVQYILTVTSGDSSCVHMDTIDITVIPIKAFFDIQNEGDTIFLCLDDSIRLDAFIEPENASFEWNTDFGLSDPTSQNPWAKPDVTTTYIFTATTDECMRSDTVLVKVDSLPLYLDTIATVPEKDPYCAGDTINLISPSFNRANFPDMTFLWMPMDETLASDSSVYNATVAPLDTTTYMRFVFNGGCLDTNMITVNVIPPEIPLSTTDTTLCPGEQFQVFVLDQSVEDLMWMPTEGLSCESCFDPNVTVIMMPGSTQTHTVMGMKSGCPVGGQLSINVPPLRPIPDTVIFFCPGDPAITVDYSNRGLADFSWSVINGIANLSCNDCPNPTISGGSDATIQFVAGVSTDPNFCGGIGRIFLDQAEEQPQIICINLNPPDSTLVGEDIGVQVQGASSLTGSWTLNGMSLPDSLNQITVQTIDTENTFTFEYTSINGCEISVSGTCPAVDTEPEYPEAFTPNGDELNDFFVPRTFGTYQLDQLRVYNRWGQLVYDGNDLEGWDGKFNGEEASADVYVYTANFIRNSDGQRLSIKGDVALMR